MQQMNPIDKEVYHSVYTSLSGVICDVESYEENKPTPNQDVLNHYLLVGKALHREHRFFSNKSDLEIENQMSLLCPILKELRQSNNKELDEQILQKHHSVFLDLIKKTKVCI